MGLPCLEQSLFIFSITLFIFSTQRSHGYGSCRCEIGGRWVWMERWVKFSQQNAAFPACRTFPHLHSRGESTPLLQPSHLSVSGRDLGSAHPGIGSDRARGGP